MITIQSALLVVLGFLVASLIVLLIAPAYWRRAVRLTSKRLKETLPMSEAEIRAEQDRIRAQYAMRVHRLETDIKDSKLAGARRLIEINRRDATISGLETELDRLKASLEENQNARRVLEQTVADRLPKVEQRLAEAKRMLFNRDRDIAELNQSAKKQAQALSEAISINAQQNAQIDRLNMSLATRPGKRREGMREPGFEIELALRSELEALRAKSREQAAMIGRLQGQLGLSYRNGSAEQRGPNGIEAADAELSRLKESLSDAEESMKPAAGYGAGGAASGASAFDQRIQQLKAKAQDQAGEIARLRAALATFETADDGKPGMSIRDSKIALRARLNAAQVQADQQSHVIQQLRTELAAAHERTALQAQHFKNQLRRLGAGTMPAAGIARAKEVVARPVSLSERIAQPRGGAASDRKSAAKADSKAAAEATPPAAGNGAVTGGNGAAPANGTAASATADKQSFAQRLKAMSIPSRSNAKAAANGDARGGSVPPPLPPAKSPPQPLKKPQLDVKAAAADESGKEAAPVNDAPSKGRLLDRITGIAKS